MTPPQQPVGRQDPQQSQQKKSHEQSPLHHGCPSRKRAGGLVAPPFVKQNKTKQQRRNAQSQTPNPKLQTPNSKLQTSNFVKWPATTNCDAHLIFHPQAPCTRTRPTHATTLTGTKTNVDVGAGMDADTWAWASPATCARVPRSPCLMGAHTLRPYTVYIILAAYLLVCPSQHAIRQQTTTASAVAVAIAFGTATTTQRNDSTITVTQSTNTSANERASERRPPMNERTLGRTYELWGERTNCAANERTVRRTNEL